MSHLIGFIGSGHLGTPFATVVGLLRDDTLVVDAKNVLYDNTTAIHVAVQVVDGKVREQLQPFQTTDDDAIVRFLKYRFRHSIKVTDAELVAGYVPEALSLFIHRIASSCDGHADSWLVILAPRNFVVWIQHHIQLVLCLHDIQHAEPAVVIGTV